MIDINLDECTTAVDKIVLNSKLFNYPFKTNFMPDFNVAYASIKSYKSLPSVTSIEIKGKNIIKIHKTIFLNLINLINIDLSDNRLMKISKNFKLFKNLKFLKLNNNQITFIPQFIGELNQLEHLSLFKNFINVIPSSIQDLSKLKLFDISSNKVEDIPMEFGFLNSLNTLHIDCNNFTKIPTTLYNLKKLNDFSFEWLEFVNPPYYKNVKDSIGKIIISFFLKVLKNMFKEGILFCDFQTFIEEMSIKKMNNGNSNTNINFDVNDSLLNRSGINNELQNSQFCGSSITMKSNTNIKTNNKYLKIFNAIEGGYYGVIKSMLEGEYAYEFLTIKNIENRAPLSYCMSKNNELIDLFLSKIKEHKIELSYHYLFKAIKMRNPELVKKLIYLGIKVDSIDDQGKGVLHILLSVFNKNIHKCILIGNFLLSYNLSLNKLDNEGWGPIHLAAKRANKECFLWIIEKNKKLRKEGKEEFDLNLRGKNEWTPLHLAVYSLRIEETMILLEYGCDIFARNSEAKTPKQVGISNYVFSKLLSYCETKELNNKYILEIKSIELPTNQKKKVKKIKKRNSNQKEDDSSSYYDENIIINNSVTIISNLFKKTINSNKNDISIKDNENIKNRNDNLIKQKIKLITGKEKINNNKINSFLPIKQNLFNNNNNFSNVKKNDNYDSDKKNNSLYRTPKTKINNNIQTEKIENDDDNDNKNYKGYYSTNNIHDNLRKEENLNIKEIKEKLLYIEDSNFEKIKYLTEIKLNKHLGLNTIKYLLENVLNEESPLNFILIADICNYSTQNLIYGIIPTLQKLLKNKIIKKIYFIKNELEQTIKVLENLEKNPKNYMKNQDNKKEEKCLSSFNKKLSENIFESEEDDIHNIIFKDSELNEFDDIEKINDNIKFDDIFRKTENNINNKQKINKIRNIKLAKGNILNIDIKKIKTMQKINKKYEKDNITNINKFKKEKEIKLIK